MVVVADGWKGSGWVKQSHKKTAAAGAAAASSDLGDPSKAQSIARARKTRTEKKLKNNRKEQNLNPNETENPTVDTHVALFL